MEKDPSQVVAPELAKAREAMGEDDAQSIIDQESQLDEKKENESESESEKESESESDEDDDKEENKDEEDDKEEEKKDDKDSKSKSNHSTKPDRPLRAVFTQMKELRQAISVLPEIMETLKTLKANPARENSEKVDEVSPEVKAIAEELSKEGFDTNGVEKLITKVLSLTKKETASLPKDLQDKLKLLDEIKAKDDNSKLADVDAQAFNSEWNSILPNLMKQYPNADKKLLDEAKALADTIAHSEKGGVKVNDKTIKGYPLDFIIFQNKKDFDTLLKVSKRGKNIESSNKEFIDVEDDSDIDLDPSNMTPEKYKRAMNKKVKENVPEDVNIIG